MVVVGRVLDVAGGIVEQLCCFSRLWLSRNMLAARRSTERGAYLKLLLPWAKEVDPSRRTDIECVAAWWLPSMLRGNQSLEKQHNCSTIPPATSNTLPTTTIHPTLTQL